MKAYVAANGHTMVPAQVWSNRRREYVTVYAWARCTDDCPACRNGDNQFDYCGEEE